MTTATAPAQVRTPSRRGRVLRRFLRRPLAVAGFTGVSLVVVVALLAPLLAPYPPAAAGSR